MNASIRRLLVALLVLIVLVLAGSTGFFLLGHGRWGFYECVYMTVITLSTVGFGELSHMHDVPGARALTMALIVSGVGALAYVQGNLTALLVEGAIGQALRRNRMRKAIEGLSNHIVVAGCGSTGKHVIEELVATKTKFVVIDADLEKLNRISEEIGNGKLLYIHGDATDDHALVAANVAKAAGVVAALTHDKDNLFVALSARSFNPKARIVSKVVEDNSVQKLMKAGANSVVNPTMIGARRLASELIRPEVNEFLDQMLQDRDKNLRIEEVSVPAGSSFIGKMLKETHIRKETRLLVVAIRGEDRAFHYNPDSDFVIVEDSTLIVLGEAENVIKLREMVAP